eukprot:3177408-Prymnesium_polylepis.1
MVPRACMVCEWATNDTQFFHLAADLVRFKSALKLADVLVEDEIDEALSMFAKFSLSEVVTLLCSPVLRMQAPRLANRTAELAKPWRNDFESYRAFLPHRS